VYWIEFFFSVYNILLVLGVYLEIIEQIRHLLWGFCFTKLCPLFCLYLYVKRVLADVL